jgi:DNA recombination protein Rad52
MITDAQKKALEAPLDPAVVKPAGNGVKGDYIEGWHAINEANRIFGFDGWSYTTELKEVSQLTNQNGNIEIGYICKCTVEALGVTRQDIGYGSGAAKKAGDAHEGAVKEAVTDALKRCLRSYGNVFGLALYDKSRANVSAPVAAMIEDSQRDELQAMIEGYGFNILKVCQHFKIASLKEIPADKFETVKTYLNNAFDKKKAKEAA